MEAQSKNTVERFKVFKTVMIDYLTNVIDRPDAVWHVKQAKSFEDLEEELNEGWIMDCVRWYFDGEKSEE